MTASPYSGLDSLRVSEGLTIYTLQCTEARPECNCQASEVTRFQCRARTHEDALACAVYLYTRCSTMASRASELGSCNHALHMYVQHACMLHQQRDPCCTRTADYCDWLAVLDLTATRWANAVGSHLHKACASSLGSCYHPQMQQAIASYTCIVYGKGRSTQHDVSSLTCTVNINQNLQWRCVSSCLVARYTATGRRMYMLHAPSYCPASSLMRADWSYHAGRAVLL